MYIYIIIYMYIYIIIYMRIYIYMIVITNYYHYNYY